MKLLFPLLGLGAAAALLAANGKTASASGLQPGKSKQQQRAEWMAAIAQAKTESYEQYVKVLNAAYKTGLFTQDEIASLQKQHRNFPKAQSGSATSTASSPGATASSGSSGSGTSSAAGKPVEQQVAEALATNNPKVLRALAAKLKSSHPQAAADLESAALAIEQTNQTFGRPVSEPLPPPVAPAPKQTSSQAKKKKPAASKPATAKPAPKSEPVVEAGYGPAADDRKDLALQVARHLTTAKKGAEDRALVERFQRSENQKRVLEKRDDGLNPDGRYGVTTAYALSEYGLVPPKPLYWGKANDWASVGKGKAAWKQWCLSNATKDSARTAEWTGASKV
jgi:hypothetical protein